MGSYQVLPFRARVDVGVMAMKRCSAFTKAPESLEPHHPQDTNCTATCPLSRKLFKLDEPDMQDIAGEAGTNA